MTTRSLPTRRSMLKGAAALVTAAAMPAWYLEEVLAQDAPRAPRSANDTPSFALIGCGGRGRGDARDAQKFGRIAAVCDVDAAHVEGAAVELAASQREAEQKAGRTPSRGGAADIRKYSDFRKLLDTEKDIPIDITGTPDHWHTLVNLRALHSGKDVYSEKPLTLTIDEGKHLVQAVRQTGRVLQV